MTIGSPAAGRPRLAALLAGGAALVTVLILLPFVLNGLLLDLVLNVMSTVMSAAAGFACLRAARRVVGPTRRGWITMAVACWAWAVSEALWTLCTDVLEAELPYPSPVELGYMIFPVAGILGLRWLAGETSALSASRRVLDRLMVGCALGLVAWVAVLDTVVAKSVGVLVTDLLSLYFPLTDVVLVTVVVLTFAQLRHDLLRWGLLGAGMLLMAVTDHVFVYELAHGSFRGGTSFAWGWWISFALIGAGALVPARARPPAGTVRSAAIAVWTGLVPYVPLVAAAVVAGANLIIAIEDDSVSEFLLVALVLLVLSRQYVMLRDNVALARTVAQRDEQLHHLAFHDGLTGLANRALFLDRLGHALDMAGRHGRPISVAFLDLDGFKAVNDSLGHAVGDALLIRVADRLRGSLRATDTLARLGGDEFAALIEHGDDPTAVANGLIEALEAPFRFDERTVGISASVGLATLGPGRLGAEQAEALLQRADVAMYAVKASGKGRVQVHSRSLDIARQRDRSTLDRAFATALERGQIHTVYQPVVDPRSGRIDAVEALPRWTHEGQVVPASTFLPICEQSGLSDQLTSSVLAQALDQLDRWSHELGHRRLWVAVGVDRTELADGGLPDRIADLLARHRLVPGQLTLEMAELVAGDRSSMQVMNELREIGVRFALDDFGANSSLGRLSNSLWDTVRFDGLFVSDIDHDPRQQRVLGGLLELARHLGLRTMVEGVDRPGQLRELSRLGCDLVQGHVVGRPVDASRISALVLAELPIVPPGHLDAVVEQRLAEAGARITGHRPQTGDPAGPGGPGITPR